MKSKARSLLCALLLVGGCASTALVSHDQALSPLLRRVEQGDAASAASTLERRYKHRGDLLFHLEQGELQRAAGRFDLSISSWREAERLFTEQEDQRGSVQQWLDGSLQLLVNDKARPYAGHDFERVLMSSRLALDHIARGRWDEARIEVRRSHELEARIAERQIEREQALEARLQQKRLPSWKEIGSYPVEVIDAPEIMAMRNSYQSAFSHYLAGFVYEALGENSLAAAGYRKAIELQPGRDVLEQGLRKLDRRPHRKDGTVDTLIVVEADWAPRRLAQNFTVPLPYSLGNGYWGTRLASISFPVIAPTGGQAPQGWTLDALALEPELVTDTALLARRALRDEMPMIMLRSASRAISRWALSASLDRRPNGVGSLTSALLQLGGAWVEQADDRCWRSLPGRFYLARRDLAPGSHQLAVPGLPPLSIEIAADRPHQLLVLRWWDQRVDRIQ